MGSFQSVIDTSVQSERLFFTAPVTNVSRHAQIYHLWELHKLLYTP